jgi:hypothetical protein
MQHGRKIRYLKMKQKSIRTANLNNIRWKKSNIILESSTDEFIDSSEILESINIDVINTLLSSNKSQLINNDNAFSDTSHLINNDNDVSDTSQKRNVDVYNSCRQSIHETVLINGYDIIDLNQYYDLEKVSKNKIFFHLDNNVNL